MCVTREGPQWLIRTNDDLYESTACFFLPLSASLNNPSICFPFSPPPHPFSSLAPRPLQPAAFLDKQETLYDAEEDRGKTGGAGGAAGEAAGELGYRTESEGGSEVLFPSWWYTEQLWSYWFIITRLVTRDPLMVQTNVG